MKLIYRILVLSSLLIAAFAIKADAFGNGKNEFRIGYGDALFETLCFHGSPATKTSDFFPTDLPHQVNEGYKYSGHVYFEYTRALSEVWSVGVSLDWEKVRWMASSYSASDKLTSSEQNHFTNHCLLVSGRANWLRKEHFKMYSGLGLGLNVNSGSEVDYMGRSTILAPALNLCIVGGRYEWENFFVGMELGGLSSLKNGQEIFMLFSRMFNISAGIKF